jgi:hypothetical protein
LPGKLVELMRGLKTWAETNMDDVLTSRAPYDARNV